jgi:hypothetical protein
MAEASARFARSAATPTSVKTRQKSCEFAGRLGLRAIPFMRHPKARGANHVAMLVESLIRV